MKTETLRQDEVKTQVPGMQTRLRTLTVELAEAALQMGNEDVLHAVEHVVQLSDAGRKEMLFASAESLTMFSVEQAKDIVGVLAVELSHAEEEDVRNMGRMMRENLQSGAFESVFGEWRTHALHTMWEINNHGRSTKESKAEQQHNPFAVSQLRFESAEAGAGSFNRAQIVEEVEKLLALSEASTHSGEGLGVKLKKRLESFKTEFMKDPDYHIEQAILLIAMIGTLLPSVKYLSEGMGGTPEMRAAAWTIQTLEFYFVWKARKGAADAFKKARTIIKREYDPTDKDNDGIPDNIQHLVNQPMHEKLIWHGISAVLLVGDISLSSMGMRSPNDALPVRYIKGALAAAFGILPESAFALLLMNWVKREWKKNRDMFSGVRRTTQRPLNYDQSRPEYKPVSRPVNQPLNQPVYRPVNQPVTTSVSRPAPKPVEAVQPPAETNQVSRIHGFQEADQSTDKLEGVPSELRPAPRPSFARPVPKPRGNGPIIGHGG